MKYFICIYYIQSMIDKDSDIDLADFRSFKNQSECYSDLLGFKNIGKSPFMPPHLFHPEISKNGDQQLPHSCIEPNDGEECYNLLFSPEKAAQSLISRNQHLEMKYLENSQSEPSEEIYENRIKKVSMLNSRETVQKNTFHQLKQRQPQKYDALVLLMKLFADVKKNLIGIRNDYYSAKTFNALKNCSAETLNRTTKILKIILEEILALPLFSVNLLKNGIDQRLVEFLIIPRFLISSSKVNRFIKDEELQQNFKFFVYTCCLGHYNNEANKKLPQLSHVEAIKHLLMQKNGRERYKKISSINHGGKLFTMNQTQYFNLFKKSLQSLSKIDNLLKKKKKKLNVLIKQFINYKDESQIQIELETKIKEFSQSRSCQHDTKRDAGYRQGPIEQNFSEYINSDFKEDKNVKLKKSATNLETSKNTPRNIFSKLKKATSLPTETVPFESQQQQKPKKRFGFRRALTLQIVQPPQNSIPEEELEDENEY